MHLLLRLLIPCNICVRAACSKFHTCSDATPNYIGISDSRINLSSPSHQHRARWREDQLRNFIAETHGQETPSVQRSQRSHQPAARLHAERARPQHVGGAKRPRRGDLPRRRPWIAHPDSGSVGGGFLGHDFQGPRGYQAGSRGAEGDQSGRRRYQTVGDDWFFEVG